HQLDVVVGQEARGQGDHFAGVGDLHLAADEAGGDGGGEEVVGVDDRRALGHLLDDALLVVVGERVEDRLTRVLTGKRLEVEDVLVSALPHPQGSRGRHRIDHAVLFRHRGGGEAEEAGEGPQQDVDVVDVDEPLHLGDRHLRVGSVVFDLQLHRTAEQSATGVDLVHAALVAVTVLGACDRARAGEVQRGRGGGRDALRRPASAGGGAVVAGPRRRGGGGAPRGRRGGGAARRGGRSAPAAAGGERQGEGRHD